MGCQRRPAWVKGRIQPIARSTLTIRRLTANWAIRSLRFARSSFCNPVLKLLLRPFGGEYACEHVYAIHGVFFLGVYGFYALITRPTIVLCARSQDSSVGLSVWGTCRDPNSTAGHRVSSPYRQHVFSKPEFWTDVTKRHHGRETAALRRCIHQASCT